jgi:predicted PurR-regulated permease PerM
MVKQFEQLARRRGLLRTAGIERHLWQIPAMCDVLIVLGSVCALWFLYALRDIFLPVFLALILAHVINPFVTLMERRWAWPRPLTISGILTVIAASVLGLFIWLGPVLYEQSTMLVNKFPTYLNTLAATYGVESGDLINRIDESIRKFQIDPQKVLGQLFRTTGHAVGILTFIFTSATYLALSIVLFAIYLFFFSWHFNTGLAKLSAYVPESRKERVFGTIGKMDAAIGDFFRGRLLISVIVGMLLSVGWFLAGVPYWFFLGMLTGFLNIVPYLSLVSWPVAIILKYLDALTTSTAQSAGILAIVVWPTIVYVAVQLLEGWILTPWIQSGQTNLSAATIILVVTIGAVLAGVLGMLLAIPIAACVKIFFEEVVLPPLKRWAAMH